MSDYTIQSQPFATHLAHPSLLDQRDSLAHSPTLSAVFQSHSPAVLTPQSSALSLSAVDESLSSSSLASSSDIDPEHERIRALIHGYSSKLINSVVRAKAWADLQRIDEIFASPSEQVHLSKLQRWKLSLRQQRLRLMLQCQDQQLLAQSQSHQQSLSLPLSQGSEEETDSVSIQPELVLPDSSSLSLQSESSITTATQSQPQSLTILTTPTLPGSAPSLTRELSSFSLYTPESARTTRGPAFTFAIQRSPSAPPEAHYQSDECIVVSSDSEQPRVSSPHSARLPPRPSSQKKRSRAQQMSIDQSSGMPPLPEPVGPRPSRSGRPSKRRFNLSQSRSTESSQSTEQHSDDSTPSIIRAWERDDVDEAIDEEQSSADCEDETGI